MVLSIKNTETERLARELAAATGDTVTSAVTSALRHRLDELGTGSRSTAVRDQLGRISADAAARWPDAMRGIDHGEVLYDDQGLPQ